MHSLHLLPRNVVFSRGVSSLEREHCIDNIMLERKEGSKKNRTIMARDLAEEQLLAQAVAGRFQC